MSEKPVIFPFFFALAPLFSLYARNAQEVAASEVVLPSLIVLAVVTLVWLIHRFLFKDPDRAGYWTLVAIITFYTIDYLPGIATEIIIYITSFWVRYTPSGESVWACIPGVALYFTAGYFLERAIPDRKRMTSFLNLFSMILVTLPLITLAQSKPKLTTSENAPSPPAIAELPQTDDRPDIYYIILDAFARADVLKENFNYDLEPFLKSLEKRGFYIARESTSNYCGTMLSLSSSLNGVYHRRQETGGAWEQITPGYFTNNAAYKSLKPLGYRLITFSTGYDPTDQPAVDLYLSPYSYSSEFHRLIVSNSVLRFFASQEQGDEYSAFRMRTNFTLSKLPLVAKMPGPKFVFAHMVSPHPPFVFGENGEDVSPHQIPYRQSDGDIYLRYYGDEATYVKGYRAQAAYLISRVDKVIDEILANSAKPPVIMLQSDHGSGLHFDVMNVDATDHLSLIHI